MIVVAICIHSVAFCSRDWGRQIQQAMDPGLGKLLRLMRALSAWLNFL